MATAIVAGAAALLMEQTPGVTPDVVKQTLVAQGDDQIPGLAPAVRVNAAKALGSESRGLGNGGPGGPAWVSCDDDHDGVLDSVDDCPLDRGTVGGCPDADSDGVRDLDDNCDSVANPGQGDADRDARGDACDPTLRGEDVDGDGRPALDDRCPTQPAATPDGCPVVVAPPPQPGPSPGPPVPTATPEPPPAAAARILSINVRVTPKRCTRGRSCRKAAKVTVRVSRTATVALRVERQVRKRGRLTWQRVTSRSLTATSRGRSLTVRGRRAAWRRGPTA